MSREVKMAILKLRLYMAAILIHSIEPLEDAPDTSHHNFGFEIHDKREKKGAITGCRKSRKWPGVQIAGRDGDGHLD